MASHSDSKQNFGEAISDTTSSVQHANQSVEALMGQLVDGVDGRPRKVDEFQRQELIYLTIQLKDLGDKSEKFQNDAQEAYGFNTVELRFPRGRARDSGYGSKSIAQGSKISDTSSSRQSDVKIKSDSSLSKEETARKIPSNSNGPSPLTDNHTTKDTTMPSFYLKTPPTSSTSLATEDPDNPTKDLPNSTPEEPSVSDNFGVPVEKINNLSKPPSEEDNLKQPF
ncbi:uncharacterized protein LOC132740151 [Ruditapes philippinarum]|uniref:uncharacterized protein LOC132740151 n=1 Tax=Ruditapes philippinarum TaxID=129788 RepID=UPI00295AEBA9|nr:uncharacterized protein LOC132740151 [Ruditapes philippinarum]